MGEQAAGAVVGLHGVELRVRPVPVRGLQLAVFVVWLLLAGLAVRSAPDAVDWVASKVAAIVEDEAEALGLKAYLGPHEAAARARRARFERNTRGDRPEARFLRARASELWEAAYRRRELPRPGLVDQPPERFLDEVERIAARDDGRAVELPFPFLTGTELTLEQEALAWRDGVSVDLPDAVLTRVELELARARALGWPRGQPVLPDGGAATEAERRLQAAARAAEAATPGPLGSWLALGLLGLSATALERWLHRSRALVVVHGGAALNGTPLREPAWSSTPDQRLVVTLADGVPRVFRTEQLPRPLLEEVRAAVLRAPVALPPPPAALRRLREG